MQSRHRREPPEQWRRFDEQGHLDGRMRSGNSLLGMRLATNVFRRNDTALDDADYLTEWAAVLAARIAPR